MRNHFRGSILLVLAVSALALNLRAQTGSSGKAAVDLSGVWDGAGKRSLAGPGGGGPPDSLGGIPAAGFSKEEPPMKPAALAIYKERRPGDRGPKVRGMEAWDPGLYPYCMPRAFPRIYNFDPLIEIVQTPKKLFMMFETNDQVRRIYLDGKKHLEGWQPTLLGVSSGHWEGNTLVVVTDNLDSLDNHNWLDALGHPFTDALQVTERITRPAHDTMQIDFVFDDPGAYTKPWPGKKVFALRTDGVDLTITGFCQQHQREDYLRDVHAGTPRGQPW